MARSGPSFANLRSRLRRPPLQLAKSMPLTRWYACGTDAHSENRSAHVPDHGWRCVRERLYSPSLQTESNTADQHKLGPSQYPGLPPSAMRPSVQGSGGLRSRTVRARARTVLVGTVMLTVAQLLDR